MWKYKNILRYPCRNNSRQLFSYTKTVYNGVVDIVCRYNIQIDGKIPKKPWNSYKPEFLDWIVEFHAKRMHMHEWASLPAEIVHRIKVRAMELHPSLEFNTKDGE